MTASDRESTSLALEAASRDCCWRREDPDARLNARRAGRPSYAECPGLTVDPDDVLETTFDENHDELVWQGHPVYSICEHHLVRGTGRAAVGYIPGQGGRITGLSKLAPVVDL